MKNHFNTRVETRTFFRVISKDYANEDFKTIEEAIEKANEQNKYRIDTTNSTKDQVVLWRGHEAEIVEVTETIRKLHPYNIEF